MKTRWILIILLVTAVSLTACSKEEPEPQAPTESDATEAAGMADSLKESATKAVEEALTMEIDVDKAVADLKAEAAKMSLEDLQAIATKYKDAIMEKNVEIEKITEKIKAIPMAEKMGTEAQELTGELKTLGEALKPLSERFQVYVDAVKAKGGDISAFSL